MPTPNLLTNLVTRKQVIQKGMNLQKNNFGLIGRINPTGLDTY